MYKINSTQQELLDKIFCGILPNDRFNPEIATEILNELDSFIKEDELYGIYYILWRIINNLRLIKLYRSKYSQSLTRDTFESAIVVAVNDLIVQPEFEASMYFNDCGVTFDLTVPAQVEEASNYVYSELLNKYDEIFDLGIDPEESLANVAVLKEDIKMGIATMMISLQGQCITNGVKYGYKTYRGYEDWIDLNNKLQAEISARFKSEKVEKRYKLHPIADFSSSVEFDNKHKNAIKNLFFLGFEPLDSLNPIRTEDIYTLVADEGTGKTKLSIYACYQAMMAGVNVLFCCGETAAKKVKRGLEALHIWKLYKAQFSYNEIDNPDSIMVDEMDYQSTLTRKAELAQTIRASQVDLYENPSHGKIIFVQDLIYEKFEEQITKAHEEFPFDLVILDHVGALDRDGSYVAGERLINKNARITHLYECEDRLVKELNIAFWNTSHTDRDTATANVKGKEVGVRISAESSAPTKWSSVIMLLTQNDDAKRNNQIILQLKKTRDTDPYTHPIVINRLGMVNDHEYLPEMQYMANGVDANDDFEELIDI